MKALHELTQEEYIKHLESYLIDGAGCERCMQCQRVDSTAWMTQGTSLNNCPVWVCDTCLPAWERAEQKAQEIAESDERDYRQAKGRD